MKEPGIGVQIRGGVFVHLLVISVLVLVGCGPALSPPEEVKQFDNAGPEIQGVGMFGQSGRTGAYRVVCGDLLEMQMPTIFLVISSDLSESIQKIKPFLCRVNDEGVITLPIVGQLEVSGRTLAEIEALVVEAYYPKYVVNRPSVVCTVEEYKNENDRVFTVMGLVKRPSAFPYPPDVQYNLMEALAFAGGFNLVADPRYVKIYRQDSRGEIVSATFGIDNDSLEDAYTVLIKPGDVVYVDHTFRTRTNVFLSDVLRIGVGADVRYSN